MSEAVCEVCGQTYNPRDLDSALAHIHGGAQWAALLDPNEPIRFVAVREKEAWSAASPDLGHFVFSRDTREALDADLLAELEQYCGRPVTIRWVAS